MNQSMAISGRRLFLVVLFAYSSLVQLNDPDWYFWFPFYSLACTVNLVHVVQASALSRGAAIIGILSAIALLLKVIVEGCLDNGKFLWAELFSLDLEKRLAREKMGSVFVLLSMWLEAKSSGMPSQEDSKARRDIMFGHTLLVFGSICLCAAYFIPKLF
ncbi:hypothetical protein O6H91_09G099200 [Diphasiastrum complanatum]|uniref:Uncharacterized protein n=1 Tax=Diphasiastrum complanatum TaxID=34168 RepID=A0ACC2CSF0_DIPCM|nr:hypothetical protein O6H91_09G099200 [Diphasiastrum complanatum]